MDTLHETVEVNPHLAIKRQRLVEGVHQVGFTAAYPTPEIQALDRLFLAFFELAEKFGLGLAAIPFGFHQFVVQ